MRAVAVAEVPADQLVPQGLQGLLVGEIVSALENAAAGTPSADVIATYADWLSFSDPAAAVPVYRRLADLEPDGVRGLQGEAAARMRSVDLADGVSNEESVTCSIAAGLFEAAAQRAAGGDRAFLQAQAVLAAACAGDLPRAQALLALVLATAPSSPAGDIARFAGHEAVGSALLAAGASAEAVEELRRMTALATHGSLPAGVPGTRLAAALLEAGETEVVLEFVKAVEACCEPVRAVDWRNAIEAGRTPDWRVPAGRP